jgi:carbon monoxide dehydrogenase subunit G
VEFHHSFSVAAPIDAVWAAMTDVERVAPCVPNTRVTARAGEDSYDVEITAAVGPLFVTAAGNITLAEHDDATRREVLRVVARDTDGDTLADATIAIVLTQAASGIDATVHSIVEVGGIAIFVAQDTLDEVAGRTLQTFAANLQALLAQAPGDP